MGSGAVPGSAGRMDSTYTGNRSLVDTYPGRPIRNIGYASQVSPMSKPSVSPLANLFGNVQSNIQSGAANALSNAQNTYQTSPANVQQNLQQGFTTLQGMTPEQRQLASSNLHNSPLFAGGNLRNNPLYYGLQALGNPGMFKPPGT